MGAIMHIAKKVQSNVQRSHRLRWLYFQTETCHCCHMNVAQLPQFFFRAGKHHGIIAIPVIQIMRLTVLFIVLNVFLHFMVNLIQIEVGETLRGTKTL